MKPYPYQETGIAWLVENVQRDEAQGRLLADGRGLGKTLQLIHAARLLVAHVVANPPRDFNDFAPLIIVLSPGTTRGDWKKEFELCWPEAKCFVMWSGKNVDELMTDVKVGLRCEDWTAPIVLIVSINEQLLTSMREVSEVIADGRLPILTIVDEAHQLKNWKAKRSQAAYFYVARAWRAMLSTGTPIFNRGQDLFNLLRLMQPSVFQNFFRWASKYFFIKEIDIGERVVHQLGALLHPERLKADSAHLIFGRSAKEVWGEGLPARNFITQKVQAKVPRLSPAKLRQMKESAHELQAVLSTCAKLKLDAVAEYLFDCEEPAVAYVYEREHAELLVKKLAERKVSAISATGALSPEKRATAINSWKAGGAQVLVCTMGAVREGTTLTRASLMVFADYDYVWSVMLQCMGRIDPARQQVSERRPVRYVFFSIEGGPDEVVADVLFEKIKEGNVLVGDDVAENLKAELARGNGRENVKNEVLSPETMLANLVARIEARAALMERLS